MTAHTARPAGPPSKHQLAVMIWLCVFPTLTVINVSLADWLHSMGTVLRTFVLATIAVPIVIYGLMPQLHRVRIRIVLANATRNPITSPFGSDGGERRQGPPVANSPANRSGSGHRSPPE